jgi:mono/diheme cytochrome c family protein
LIARAPDTLAERDILRSRTVRTFLSCLPAFLLALPAAAQTPVESPPLAAAAQAVLRTHCYRCHGLDGASKGGFGYVLNRAELIAHGKIVPSDVGHSKLYRRVSSGDMPPEEVTERPSDADVATLRRWIEAGAPDFSLPAARRTFLPDSEMLRLIHADLGKASKRDCRHLRYFTLTHLANAGVSEQDLQTYRAGLSKLVNSLSRNREIVVPSAIDPARTIFRIDLRDYDWDARVWDTILGSNPYGVLHDTPEARACAALTECALPYVRADWFVKVASQPPLYYDLLQLPRTEQELEKMLGLDTASKIKQERVARAGFNGSGVSNNNRIIERHASQHGAYWKSYDFAGNTGARNVFEHPLGPVPGETGFHHDGGEIIFSLPNGLQAYFLANARGERLDKGPITIVSDPKQGDHAVVAGVSCMSCHARGIIEKADQIRPHIEANRAAFPAEEADTVRALYPPREVFAALQQQDAERFTTAARKTGVQPGQAEPIVALAKRFEDDVSLAQTAAEAGLPPDTFLKGLQESSRLAKLFGVLKQPGGLVKRQVLEEHFADLARDLQLGTLYVATRPQPPALTRVEGGAETAAVPAKHTEVPLIGGQAKVEEPKPSTENAPPVTSHQAEQTGNVLPDVPPPAEVPVDLPAPVPEKRVLESPEHEPKSEAKSDSGGPVSPPADDLPTESVPKEPPAPPQAQPPAVPAAAVAPAGPVDLPPHQCYTDGSTINRWTYHPDRNAFSIDYRFKSRPEDPTYTVHNVLYYPDKDPDHVYFYNPEKRAYWGRSPLAVSPQNPYQYLQPEDRGATLAASNFRNAILVRTANGMPAIPAAVHADCQRGPLIAPPPPPPAVARTVP